MASIVELLNKYKLTNVEDVDENGNTLLHLATKNEKLTQKQIIEVLEVLLDKGIDLDAKNKKNETVLQLAINNRMKDVIEFLLTRQAKINSAAHFIIEDEFGKFQDLLRQSLKSDSEKQIIESESATFLEWLILKGLNIDAKDDFNRSVLLLAIERNMQHILPILLKYSKDSTFVDRRNRTLLHLFLEKKGDYRGISKNWYSKRYEIEIVKILLDRGVSVDAEDNSKCTSIRLAIENEEDIDLIQMLVEHSKNVNHKNSEGETLFYTIISKWLESKEENIDYYMKIADVLIVKGADVNEPDEDGNRPVYLAIRRHNLSVVEFLQKNGADFNVTNVHGETLMHFLGMKPYSVKTTDEMEIKLFDILVSNGCQIDAKDKTGLRPLHTAALSNLQIVRKLLEHDVSVNCRTNEMETPLHLAMLNPQAPMVAGFLLKHGANVDAKDSKGQTALHKIALWPRFEHSCAALSMLLSHGADINARDLENRTVLNCARSRDLDDYNERRLQYVAEYNNDRMSDCYLFGYERDEDDYPPPYMTLGECPIMDMASEVVKSLTKHSIKLKAANLPWDEQINGWLGRFFGFNDDQEFCTQYYEKCSKEIQKMKSTKIDDHTSLYDFLHMDPKSRYKYIDEIFNLPKLEFFYPNYEALIWASRDEAVTRMALLEPARKAWLELTKINLPAICLDLIFSFLSNSDLLVLLEKD